MSLKKNLFLISEEKMKEINTFQLIKVPAGIEATVNSRIVTVKGTRGELVKDFKHLAVDIYMPDKKTIKVKLRQISLKTSVTEP